MTKAPGEALRMVARRGYFTEELREKLQKKGYPEEEIADALEKLTALGYLNDEERRRCFIEKKQKRGYGPAAIALQLKAKGGGEVEMSGEEERAVIVHFLEKRHPTWRASSWEEKRRLFARLQRRGFSTDLIHQILYTA
jgi:regulatory protein